MRSKKPKLRPTVMSANEVGLVLAQLSGRYCVMGQLLYGTGMRISELLRLRVKELRWQFLFASRSHSRDPKTHRRHRHHIHRDSFAAVLRKAVGYVDGVEPEWSLT